MKNEIQNIPIHTWEISPTRSWEIKQDCSVYRGVKGWTKFFRLFQSCKFEKILNLDDLHINDHLFINNPRDELDDACVINIALEKLATAKSLNYPNLYYALQYNEKDGWYCSETFGLKIL